jgi:hypothetical protein
MKKLNLLYFIFFIVCSVRDLFGNPLFGFCHYYHHSDGDTPGYFSVYVRDEDITYAQFAEALKPGGELGTGSGVIRELDIENCSNLEALPDLSGLLRVNSSLIELHIENCTSLKTVSVLRGLPYLQELTIARCPELEEIRLSSEETSLFRLRIRDCPKIKNIILHKLPLLRELHIDGCNCLKLLDASELPVLKELYIYNSDFSPRFEILDYLQLRELWQLRQPPHLLLRVPDNLNYLYLSRCKGVRYLYQVGELKHLKGLFLSGPEIDELPDWLLLLPELKHLYLVDTPLVKGISESTIMAATDASSTHEDVLRLLYVIREKEARQKLVRVP